jgi:hypothetical protein
MNAKDDNIDWKLKLKFGKLKTPFRHYSVIAEGVVGELKDGFSCRPGSAFMGDEDVGNFVRRIGAHDSSHR